MASADPRGTKSSKKSAPAPNDTDASEASSRLAETNIVPPSESAGRRSDTVRGEASRPASSKPDGAPRDGARRDGAGRDGAVQDAGARESAGRDGASRDRAGESDPKKSKRLSQLGDFKLEKKLGQGGMGTVFLATQISLDRKVALKTLSPEFAKKPDFVQRFLREARSMARLQHPNVVQVYAADTVSGVNYAAIEFIDGRSMQGWMNELNQLSIGDALHVVLVCADALKHAHDQNMIHRDIKPDNILVTSKGVIKVADFGLAKALDEDVSMTQSGTGLGTPLYMAPEQARNAKHVDQRTDIYALGCMLYYFLTGKLPFTGTNTMELIIAKEKGTFTRARKLNSQVPERLDLMIEKMLMKDPKHRYADCAEIIDDLSALGLATSSLSFIDSAGGAARINAALAGAGSGASAATSRPGASRPQTTRGSGPATDSAGRGARPVAPDRLTSAEDAARSAAKAPVMQRTWFVQHKGPDGRLMITKMSTVEVLAGIKSETLDLLAKAKDAPNGSFLPLTQYREFETLASHRAVKAEAAARSRNTQAVYNKLDRQEQRRKRWRWLKRIFSNVRGIIGLIFYVAVIVAVCYAGWEFGMPMLKKLLNR